MTHEKRSAKSTTMIHHIREIQLRLLVTVLVLIAGMVVGYLFYEPLFHFIKSPLDGPLHYTSPAGSFSFIIKICLMIGVVVTLPVAVYNIIMFIQPALKERLSRTRVYVTTFLSLVFAVGGAAFAFLVIIPMALDFFFKFQVDGLEALISADDYLQFVVNVIVTFALIFQLPLIISLIDHIKPLPPKKLLKAEKFIIVGSIAIGVLVPFALDPVVQLLIASPIIILYNLSIVVVLIQQRSRRRTTAKSNNTPVETVAVPAAPTTPVVSMKPATFSEQRIIRKPQIATSKEMKPVVTSRQSVSGFVVRPRSDQPVRAAVRMDRSAARPLANSRLISDMRRPAPQRPKLGPSIE